MRRSLTRLPPDYDSGVGTLFRNAGERGPGAKRWVGEGSGLLLLLLVLIPISALAETIAEPVALLQGLDKITARVSKFEAQVGTPALFGTLSIRVRDCEKNPPEETPESAAFVEIDEMRPGESMAKRVFGGWMFASSPALSALEHPVYDIILLDCRPASGSPRSASGSTTGKETR